jgi:hypothetical protein
MSKLVLHLCQPTCLYIVSFVLLTGWINLPTSTNPSSSSLATTDAPPHQNNDDTQAIDNLLLIRTTGDEANLEQTPVWRMRQAGHHIAKYRALSQPYPTFRQRSEILEVEELSNGRLYLVLFSDNLDTPYQEWGVYTEPQLLYILHITTLDHPHSIAQYYACASIIIASGAHTMDANLR